jgi:lipopolysaccharide/colanic/teichoic acid biosynthesis glycosyltransferase
LRDWIRYDLEYVERRSLLFDLRILALTPVVVVLGKGAI